MHVCGPHRFTTGLIKLTPKENNPDTRLTWDNLNAEIIDYIPDCKNFPEETIYKKKAYQTKDFKSLTLTVQAGDIVTLQGELYDGTLIDSPVTGNIEIKFAEYGWIKNVIEGKLKNVKIEDSDKGE
jgi:hypothetical protein